MGFGSSCDFLITGYQRYKADFSTSIGWYINVISVNEITVFNCKYLHFTAGYILYNCICDEYKS